MARQRMALQDHGTVKITGQVKDGEKWRAAREGEKATRWEARTVYRDLDGKNRQVRKYGPTKAKAENLLKAALKDRQTPVGTTTGYRRDTSVIDAARLWESSPSFANLAERSRYQYRGSIANHLEGSTIASLTLREVNTVSVIEAWLQAVASKAGRGAAKTAKSVLSSILKAAQRDRAVEHNAARSAVLPETVEKAAKETRKVGRGKTAETVKVEARDTTRAFSKAERDLIVTTADGHEAAKRNDVADVIAFMAGTGARIGEALAVRWDDADLDTGTVLIRGTKSNNAERTAPLPTWLLDRLVNRAKVKGTAGVMFASPGNPRRPDLKVNREVPRDTRNVTRVVREVLDVAGFTWATAHSFRRSVATIADGAGVSLNVVARSLGQDPTTTARFYLARNVDTSAMAAAL